MDNVLDDSGTGGHAGTMTAYAYVVQCADGHYYVGSARDVEARVHQHNLGRGAAYTRCRRPVTLVWCEEFENVGEAFAMEKRIQGWSRAKREALIAGDYGRLPALSKRGYRPSAQVDGDSPSG